MIKPEELRIGNWVRTNKEEQVIDVLCDSVSTHTFQCITYDMIEGIPLSPEWLERANLRTTFIYGNGHPYYRFLTGYLCYDDEEKGYVFSITYLCNSGEGDVYPLNRALKYVHDLQNLYREIEGKELELKQ